MVIHYITSQHSYSCMLRLNKVFPIPIENRLETRLDSELLCTWSKNFSHSKSEIKMAEIEVQKLVWRS